MSDAIGLEEKSEIADGMRIDWNVPIPMDDGIVLRADVFRPIEDGRFPAIVTHGPYGKNLPFQKGFEFQWKQLAQEHPDALAGSTNKYQVWEVADPEKWVPDGYVVIRVDCRGAGASPGVLDLRSARETRDFYNCIEWAAAQTWSNGKIGLLGISYYAMNQWQVAGLHPPHLTAMIPWEGAGDSYREALFHGGILCEFSRAWFRRQVEPLQYGVGEKAPKAARTADVSAQSGESALLRQATRPLDDEWHRERSADYAKVEVPFLSSANWGGQGLHSRGNFEAFVYSASEQKWLEVHGLEHWTHFYTPYGVGLQKRFFGHFLKGERTGWEKQPPVQLNVRHADGTFTLRYENEWPIARTNWTKFYLNPGDRTLSRKPVAEEGRLEYQALGDGVTFSTTIETQTEITGPIAAKLFVSSSTRDADLFLVVRLFDPAGKEVTFTGAAAPNAPVAQGWLRASHRKLDPQRSIPYRPYHSHDAVEPLVPGQVYELEVEIWPTCVVIPPGFRLALSVRGKDYEYEGDVFRGCGLFVHGDERDRPADVFGGTVSLHAGGRRGSYVLLPIVPPRS